MVSQIQRTIRTVVLLKGISIQKGIKLPGQKDYDNTVAEEMFCTKEEAEQAGFVPAKQ